MNKHIDELQNLNNDFENRIMEISLKYRNEYLDKIGQTYQEFYEKIETSQLIYNTENKLIKLKLPNNIEKKAFLNESENFEITKNKIKFLNEILFFNFKINLGLFNKTNLNLFLYVSDDIIKNNFRKLFKAYEKNNSKNKIKSK